MDPTLNAELRGFVAAARAWVSELAEEGLDRIEATAEPVARPTASEPPPAQAAATPSASASARPTPAPRERIEEARPWGDAPTLEAVRSELGDCRRCALADGRRQIVFGDGNPDADLMFVGEGPGADEDRRGLPFVGRAGELLTAMIEKGLGIPRSDVYICNIVKCRPPGNRTPLPEEVRTCSPFLEGQIAAVRPKVIVALGGPAAAQLIGRNVSITRARGTWHEHRGIPVMLTLHPAYVLRRYTTENRRAVWEDLKAALERARG